MPRAILTARDAEVLFSLYQYRHLSIAQVRRLHFPSEQTANRRLRALERAGLLKTYRVPGVPDRLVHPTKSGLEVVAAHLNIPLATLHSVPTTHRKHPLFVCHHLEASDFRIALSEACARTSDFQLLGFLSEHVPATTSRHVARKYIRDVVAGVSHPGEKITHTPDGVFALLHNGRAALFFHEADRGTESVSNELRGFAKIAKFYLNYLRSGDFHRYDADFDQTFPAFRVLIVTSSVRRLATIRATVGALPFEPREAKRFLWIAPRDAITAETILGPVWISLDPDDQGTYAILKDDHSRERATVRSNDASGRDP